MADISQLRLPTLKKSLTGNLSPVTFGGTSNFNGSSVWTDGEHIYLDSDYVLDESTLTWTQMTWKGLVYFTAENLWTDGENIYYSYENTSQYVLDKATSTWSRKTWTGLTDFEGKYVWTDGENIYYSNGSSAQYVLNKATSTWTQKTWTGITNLNGNDIWTDGENIYYSYYSTQYVLNKATSTWTQKTWTGYTSFNGRYVWTDGDNVYFSNSSAQYVLDKTTSTWTKKTWTGIADPNGYNVWSDLEGNYYSSSGSTQYQFDAAESGEVSYENYNIKDIVARQNDASLDSRVTALEQGGGGSSYDLADHLQFTKSLTGIASSGINLKSGSSSLFVNGGKYDGYNYTGTTFSLDNANVGEVYLITALVDDDHAESVSGGIQFNGTNTTHHYMRTNLQLFTDQKYYKLPFAAQVVSKVYYDGEDIDYVVKRLMPLCDPAPMPSLAQPPDTYYPDRVEWFDVPERKPNDGGSRMVRRCCFKPTAQSISTGGTATFNVPLNKWGVAESSGYQDFIAVGGSVFVYTSNGQSPGTTYRLDIVKMVWDGNSPSASGKITVTVKNNTGESISTNNARTYVELFVEGNVY